MPFRFERKKVGATYSCPTAESGRRVDDDNPILNKEELLAFFISVGGPGEYIVGQELHESGKRHFHVWFNWDSKHQTTNQNFLDFKGVHPKIENPGKGWPVYCKKTGDFITNVKGNVFATAVAKRTWAEAAEFLWEEQPKWMLEKAHLAEENFRKKQRKAVGTTYTGPWNVLPPQEWDRQKECLWIRGVAGTGKTQWAKYFMAHYADEYCYIKGPIDKGKSFYMGRGGIIFDDIVPFEKWSINDWCSLMDVENGGSVNLRNRPLDLEPGPRVLIDNNDLEMPDDPKIARRVFIWDFPL